MACRPAGDKRNAVATALANQIGSAKRGPGHPQIEDRAPVRIERMQSSGYGDARCKNRLGGVKFRRKPVLMAQRLLDRQIKRRFAEQQRIIGTKAAATDATSSQNKGLGGMALRTGGGPTPNRPQAWAFPFPPKDLGIEQEPPAQTFKGRSEHAFQA